MIKAFCIISTLFYFLMMAAGLTDPENKDAVEVRCFNTIAALIFGILGFWGLVVIFSLYHIEIF